MTTGAFGDSTKDFQIRMRLDLKFEAAIDSVTGERLINVGLDPRRYKIIEGPDEPMVLDRLDQSVLPLRGVQEMLALALRTKPNGQGHRLPFGNAQKYVQSRVDEIRQRLTVLGGDPYQFVDRSEEFLAQLPDGVHAFAILSVDLVGSTRLSNILDPVTNARVIGVVLEELAVVVPYFHAHILKFTGDGILAYFPPHSFVTANDNAIDCALTIRRLVRDGLSRAFAEVGYPSIDVRLGIESGAAVALAIGSLASKRQRDLIGQTLNIACKIQASGNPGDLRMGQVAYQNMHTMWRLGCVTVEPPKSWTYKLADGKPYPIYLFTADEASIS